MGCGVDVEMTAAAETIAAMIDSMVGVGCDGCDGDVVTAKMCEGAEATARRGGGVGMHVIYI